MQRRSLLTGAACVSMAMLSGPAIWGGSGRCLRADVPRTMVFPDGTEHPAGTLTLCVEDYSPVASSHKVSVNGLPVGFLFSQRRVPEFQRISQPIVLFRKMPGGKLRLTGYLWPSGTKVISYRLQGEPWDADGQTRVPATELSFPPPQTGSDSPKP